MHKEAMFAHFGLQELCILVKILQHLGALNPDAQGGPRLKQCSENCTRVPAYKIVVGSPSIPLCKILSIRFSPVLVARALAGEIVAISIGTACVMVVLGALVYWVWKLAQRRRALNSEYQKILPGKAKQQQQQHAATNPPGEKPPPTLR